MKREVSSILKREKHKAVFFDRDGTLIVAPNGEPPRNPEDVEFFPWTVPSLQRLQDSEYDLFLISNQPDYMKGKATVGELQAVHNRFNYLLHENGISFREYYYCFHREEDTCDCRKPKDYFIHLATDAFDIDLDKSWMVGDRECDIMCGQNAGVSTILLGPQRDNAVPDYVVSTLWEASEIIVNGG
jgi:D-glycero-D-manno-heptose 1,7-bisphosphate phosphatase